MSDKSKGTKREWRRRAFWELLRAMHSEYRVHIDLEEDQWEPDRGLAAIFSHQKKLWTEPALKKKHGKKVPAPDGPAPEVSPAAVPETVSDDDEVLGQAESPENSPPPPPSPPAANTPDIGSGSEETISNCEGSAALPCLSIGHTCRHHTAFRQVQESIWKEKADKEALALTLALPSRFARPGQIQTKRRRSLMVENPGIAGVPNKKRRVLPVAPVMQPGFHQMVLRGHGDPNAAPELN